MRLVIGLVSPVAWTVYEVCPSDFYLQVRQFFNGFVFYFLFSIFLSILYIFKL